LKPLENILIVSITRIIYRQEQKIAQEKLEITFFKIKRKKNKFEL